MVKSIFTNCILILLLNSCQLDRFHRDYTEYDYPPFEDEKVSFYNINFKINIDGKFSNKNELLEHTNIWLKKYFISVPRYLERQRELYKSDDDIDFIIDFDSYYDVIKTEGVCIYDKKKQFFCKVTIEFNDGFINFKYFDFSEFERYSNKESKIKKGIKLNKIQGILWEMTNKFYE